LWVINSEWDFGWDGILFKSVEDAQDYIRNNYYFIEFCKDENYSLEELEGKNLISYDLWNVYAGR
jgi:hypothetical protein